MKRTMKILLMLALVLGVFSASVHAEGEERVYMTIGETQVTDANKDDIFGDGKASYDPETGNLNLTDITINGNIDVTGSDYLNICGDDATTINGTLSATFVWIYGGTVNGMIAPYGVHQFGIAGGSFICENETLYGDAYFFYGGNVKVKKIPACSALILRSGLERLEVMEGGLNAPYYEFNMDESLAVLEPEGAYFERVETEPNLFRAILLNADGSKADRVVIGPAPVETYNIWVAGINVTSANKDDVLGDGTISFDPEGSVLTLNNCDGYAPVRYTDMDLTIRGTGKLMTDHFSMGAIEGTGGDLIIEGTVSAFDSSQNFGVKLTNGDMTVAGSLSCNGFDINNGSADIQGTVSSTLQCNASSVTVGPNADFTISGSNTSATYYALYADNLKIQGSCSVTGPCIEVTNVQMLSGSFFFTGEGMTWPFLLDCDTLEIGNDIDVFSVKAEDSYPAAVHAVSSITLGDRLEITEPENGTYGLATVDVWGSPMEFMTILDQDGAASSNAVVIMPKKERPSITVTAGKESYDYGQRAEIHAEVVNAEATEENLASKLLFTLADENGTALSGFTVQGTAGFSGDAAFPLFDESMGEGTYRVLVEKEIDGETVRGECSFYYTGYQEPQDDFSGYTIELTIEPKIVADGDTVFWWAYVADADGKPAEGVKVDYRLCDENGNNLYLGGYDYIYNSTNAEGKCRLGVSFTDDVVGAVERYIVKVEIDGTEITDEDSFVYIGYENYALDHTEALIPVFETLQLNLVDPNGVVGPGTWTSSDESVVTVDENGLVTAHKYGRATIHAVMGRIEAECEIQTLFWDVAGSPNKGDPNYQYYFNPVYWAAENNITKGFDLEYFGVNMDCERQQFALFLYRLAGQPAPNAAALKDLDKMFSDVKNLSASFRKAIAWGYDKGIVKGYSSGPNAGKFGNGLPITRREAMIMLWRYAGKPAASAKGLKLARSFTDVKGTYKETSDSFKAIAWAAGAGIANGYTKEGSLPPGSGLTLPCYGCDLSCLREQMITFLYRYAN